MSIDPFQHLQLDSSVREQLFDLRLQLGRDHAWEKFELNQKIAKLEAEIERLGGASPIYRESVRESLSRSEAELGRVEALFRSSVRQLILVNNDATKTRLILDELKGNVTSLLISAIEQSEKRRQVRAIIVSFILGIATSLIASTLWTMIDHANR